MMLRRFKQRLDREFETGRQDALLIGRRNPGISEDGNRYIDWAYNAGFAQGKAEVEALCRQINPPQPRDPARTST